MKNKYRCSFYDWYTDDNVTIDCISFNKTPNLAPQSEKCSLTEYEFKTTEGSFYYLVVGSIIMEELK